MSRAITDIEGIGPKYAALLKQAGIMRTSDLLERAATRQGRMELAEATGIDQGQILKWTNMADLMRIRGVGEEYSELLEAAGVDTITELKTRKPENLYEAIAAANMERHLVRQIPGPGRIAQWVKQARALKSLMHY